VIIMKCDDNAIGSDMGIGFHVPKAQFDSTGKCFERILGPVAGTTAVSEGDRSVMFKEWVSGVPHLCTVDGNG
jgi:dihydrodipicolinate reductase